MDEKDMPRRIESARAHEGSNPETTEDLDEMFEALDAKLRAQRQGPWNRLRERVFGASTLLRRRRWFIFALTLPALALLSPRPDWRMAFDPQVILLVTACVSLTRAHVSRALRGWHEPMVQPRAAAAWSMGALGTLIGLMTLVPAHVQLPHTSVPPGASMLQHVLPCLLFGLAFAAPTLALGVWLGHHTPRSHLFAATAAGLSGNLALLLHCPITEAPHLVLGHAGVLAAAVAITWAIGLRHRGA